MTKNEIKEIQEDIVYLKSKINDNEQTITIKLNEISELTTINNAYLTEIERLTKKIENFQKPQL